MRNAALFISFLTVFVAITCGRYPENVGDGYKIDFTHRSGADKAILDSLNTVKVYGPLLDYRYDARFIVAAERPRDSIPECVGGTFDACEEAFEKSTYRQYWIIDKSKHEVHGPYTYAEYQTKFVKMNIPKILELTQ